MDEKAEEQIEKSFIPFTETNKTPHIILFRGRRVCTSSGKSIWNSKGAAKSALTHHLKSVAYKIRYYLKQSFITSSDLKEWAEQNIQVIPLVDHEKLKNL